MHRRISAHKVDRSASKSTPLNSHLVLSSLMYFRSISTAPGVHDHFLGFFVADSGAKDAFLFPCPLPHLSESGSFLSHSRRHLVHYRSFSELSTPLPSDSSELCSNDLARTERRKYSQRLYSCGNLTVIHSHKSRPFNKGDPIQSVYEAKSWPS